MRRIPTIVVLSRRAAMHATFDHPYAIISVTDPHLGPAVFRESPNLRAVLRLAFHDIDQPLASYRLLDVSEAETILAFAREQAPQIETLVVHCEAGISRSAGIAAALTRIWGGDHATYFTDGRYSPNRHVYRTILAVADPSLATEPMPTQIVEAADSFER